MSQAAAQPAATDGEVPAGWEADKAELIKAREATAEKLKELEEQARKTANLKLANVSAYTCHVLILSNDDRL